MNKEYYNEWGLYLPFRFYDDRNKVSEATDYGRQVNMPKSEFLIMPIGTILPFQVVRPSQYSTDYTLKIYCNSVEATEYDVTTLWPDVLEYFTTTTRGLYDHITFFGVTPAEVAISIPKGSYYAVFSDGTTTKYSENFTIIAEDVFTETYRSYSYSDTDLRTIDDGSTLRII